MCEVLPTMVSVAANIRDQPEKALTRSATLISGNASTGAAKKPLTMLQAIHCPLFRQYGVQAVAAYILYQCIDR